MFQTFKFQEQTKPSRYLYIFWTSGSNVDRNFSDSKTLKKEISKMWYQVLIGGVSFVTLYSLLVSVPLYVLVLVAVASNRHIEPFGSEFFSIFMALGVVDIG
jgi:hypothetical protein